MRGWKKAARADRSGVLSNPFAGLVAILAVIPVILILTVSVTLTLVLSSEDPMDKFNVRRDRVKALEAMPRFESKPVPRLIGLSEAEARSSCAGAGVRILVSRDYQEKNQPGVVIKQDPVSWTQRGNVQVEIGSEAVMAAHDQAEALAEKARAINNSAADYASAEENRVMGNLQRDSHPGTFDDFDTGGKRVVPIERAVTQSNQLIAVANSILQRTSSNMKSVVASFCGNLIQGNLEAAKGQCNTDSFDKLVSSLKGVRDYEVTRTSLDPPDPRYYSFDFYTTQVDTRVLFAETPEVPAGWHICRFDMSHDQAGTWRVWKVTVADARVVKSQ
jgi:hypothetical protein